MGHAGNSLRILAFEPFDAGSHRAVREAISSHSRHAWTWITRPGRFWKWRMRTAAIEMIEDARQRGLITSESNSAWDVIFATSLMSAADLRAMLPSSLRCVPLVLYMHENQAAYPERLRDMPSNNRDFHFALTNLTSILAADAVIWNSTWNRDSFLDGLQRILKFGPDVHMPEDSRERVMSRSGVIWPPVEWPSAEVARAGENHAGKGASGQASRVLHNAGRRGAAAGGIARPAAEEPIEQRGTPASRTSPNHRPISVVWPHRWEHDKGPAKLLDIARRYSESLNVRWTILGERYRQVPREMETFEREFADRIDHMGFIIDHDAYRRQLARCDWVLSTAQHEFFGIAVVEALLAGCLPWLPPRLSYPELLPPEARGLEPTNPPTDPEAIRAAISRHLTPALAPYAVSRLDETISKACAGPDGGKSAAPP